MSRTQERLDTLMYTMYVYLCFFPLQTTKAPCISKQVIQKISAIDKDDPPNGHQFYFSLTAEAANNHNFTLQDNKGKDILFG